MPAPTQYNPATLWPVLLTHIANGESLATALGHLNPAPSYWWAKDQLRKNPELRARYTMAAAERADKLADELLEIADTPIPPHLKGAAASAWVQQQRLRVDARKWFASKFRPKVYG